VEQGSISRRRQPRSRGAAPFSFSSSGAGHMLLETIEDLLLDQLRDLYSIETQIEVALPIIVEQTSTTSLREMLTDHFEQTEGQLVRLQEVFGALGMSARGPRCLGIAGLLQETEDTMRRGSRGAVLDSVIIACMQRVEHYEMAAYGSAIAYARQLGHSRIAELLSASLAEEAAADVSLSRITEMEVLEQGGCPGVLAA
jgi:ferritin-like metal-binding protein YciE